MFTAEDKKTGRLTSAEDAERRGRYGLRYTCPCCHEPVKLRTGAVHRPHFAHEIGVGTAECENYHPGGGYDGGSGQAAASVPPRALALYFVPDSTDRSAQSWHLELLVPRAPDSIGWVHVPSGRAGEVSVACSRLEDSARRIPVRILDDAYQLRLSGSVDPEFAKRLSVGTAGFSPSAIALFRYSEGGGRRLDDSTDLYWGRGYFAVWHKSLHVAWPLALWREQMRDMGLWSAARIELPSREDDKIIAWALRDLDRDVSRPPVSLALVHPASAARLDDDTILVSSVDTIVIGLTGEHGSETPSALNFESGGPFPATLPLEGNLPLLFGISGHPVDRICLSLDDDEPELVVQYENDARRRPVATPSLVLNDDHRKFRVPFFSEAAEAALIQVRTGTLGLADLDLSPLTKVQVRRRKRATLSWTQDTVECDAETMAANPANARAGMSARVLALLSQALTSGWECELDLGSYGRVTSRTVPPCVSHSRAIRLRPGLRSRIRWISGLARTSGATYSREEADIRGIADSLLAAGVVDEEDRWALTRLRATSHWPSATRTHVVELAARLRRVYGGDRDSE